MIEKSLRSFPKKFEVVVVSIKEFKDTGQMKIDGLIGLLISHESKMSRYDDITLENAFKTQLKINKGRGRGRSSNIGRGNIVADQRCL